MKQNLVRNSKENSNQTIIFKQEKTCNFHDTKTNNKRFTAAIMASHFSGVLQLTDLDDFITPSQVIKL